MTLPRREQRGRGVLGRQHDHAAGGHGDFRLRPVAGGARPLAFAIQGENRTAAGSATLRWLLARLARPHLAAVRRLPVEEGTQLRCHTLKIRRIRRRSTQKTHGGRLCPAICMDQVVLQQACRAGVHPVVAALSRDGVHRLEDLSAGKNLIRIRHSIVDGAPRLLHPPTCRDEGSVEVNCGHGSHECSGRSDRKRARVRGIASHLDLAVAHPTGWR